MFVNARAALRDPETVNRRRWLTLLVLCISLIVIILDNTILNVAIPTLAHAKDKGGLGASASQLHRKSRPWPLPPWSATTSGIGVRASEASGT